MEIPSPCQPMIPDQHNKGKRVGRTDAKKILNDYLSSVQNPDDPNHVYGHLFGLNRLRELLFEIDKHNTDTTNPDDQITAIRIYRGLSARTQGGPLVSDLVIAPVKRNGFDYPKGLPEPVTEPLVFLVESGPCPNVCKSLFF